jgi:hypothetical protein
MKCLQVALFLGQQEKKSKKSRNVINNLIHEQKKSIITQPNYKCVQAEVGSNRARSSVSGGAVLVECPRKLSDQNGKRHIQRAIQRAGL